METVASPPASGGEDLRLLMDWGSGEDRSRGRRAGLISVGLHVLAVVALALVPGEFFAPPEREARPAPRELARLVAPLEEPTQTVPNKGPLSKEFNAESLAARPRVHIPPAPPGPPLRAPARPPSFAPGPARGTPPVPAIAEPPRMEAQLRAPGPLPQAAIAPPPQIQAQERPRLEVPSAPPPVGRPGGAVPVPNASVSEAVRSIVRGGGGGATVVGDAGLGGAGGLGEGLNLPPSPGRQASNLELLSDPMGVDFRPYLVRILSTVRRNWFAVMPESAKLGRQGRVSIQFAIDRSGSVPKLVIVMHSGTDALDRAAVAGISASNPFPPLPAEFKGNQVRLQFNFAYNMK